jgi:hypothetical protein
MKRESMNEYPFSYSGTADSDGVFIARDVNGSNILVNFNHPCLQKVQDHIFNFGTSGEGKSFKH